MSMSAYDRGSRSTTLIGAEDPPVAVAATPPRYCLPHRFPARARARCPVLWHPFNLATFFRRIGSGSGWTRGSGSGLFRVTFLCCLPALLLTSPSLALESLPSSSGTKVGRVVALLPLLLLLLLTLCRAGRRLSRRVQQRRSHPSVWDAPTRAIDSSFDAR
jgi:hypothetical protein